jgi:hypothetical protein
MLGDEARCRVLLVTLAEETPVNELIEPAYELEDKVGVALAPVVVNAVYPTIEGLTEELPPALARRLSAPVRRALTEAAVFRCARAGEQRAQTERLAESLPLPQLPLSLRFTAGLLVSDVLVLADELLAGVGQLA